MKKTLLIVMLALLAGCHSNPIIPPQQDVIKYKYIFVTVNKEFLEIPANVPDIDINTATDKDAANWILNKEERAVNLETKLKAIKSNQDDKLKEIKDDMKIPKEDVIVK